MAEERALVLGGGGNAGVAWESGLAAGLARKGVSLAEPADFVQGTSAGSYVGANLAGGRSPEDFAQSQLRSAAKDKASAAAAPTPSASPGAGQPSLMERFLSRVPAGEATSPSVLKEMGAAALTEARVPIDALIATFGAIREPGRPWPERYACTAIDIETGEMRIWRKSHGAPILEGLSAACSVPGLYPPVTLQGRTWIDGGMRSSTNLDQVIGYKRVLVVAVDTGAGTGIGARTLARLNVETQIVKDSGSDILAILPDERSKAALRADLMTHRGDIIQAGIAQGEREAARVQDFWA